MSVLVCTTLAAFAMEDEDRWGAWLRQAEGMREMTPEPVDFFAAIEVDARGIDPFRPLTNRLEALGRDGFSQQSTDCDDWWSYSLDDGRERVTTENRLRHLTMGQNLCSEAATAGGYSHMLFMAADCMPPADAIVKLMEVDALGPHPGENNIGALVGGHVATYCFKGPEVEGYPFPVEAHMPTAAFVLVRRDLFKVLRWRYDRRLSLSDDPAYALDAETMLNVVPVIRMDVVGTHFPRDIGAVETRYSAEAMKVHR